MTTTSDLFTPGEYDHEVIYRMQADDVSNAYSLATKNYYLSRNNNALAASIFIVSTILITGFTNARRYSYIAIFTFVTILEILLYLCFVYSMALIVAKIRGGRDFKSRTHLRDPICLRWNDQGIFIEAMNGKSFIKWAYCQKFVEDKFSILLFQSDKIYTYVPKRILATKQIETIREQSLRFQGGRIG